jgi:hypothetical protein
MAMGRRTLAILLTAFLAFAQLPPSGRLSDADLPPFHAEVARIEKLLDYGGDTSTLTYLMARTWAAARQWPEALQWLERAMQSKSGIDPSRDSIFADLRGSSEFQTLVSAVRESTPAIVHSEVAFTIPEGDLAPESVAYDPGRGYFYFGSLRKGKVVRCAKSGACSDFAVGLGTVLGLKAHRGGLWLLNNSDRESALVHYDLASRRVIRKYSVAAGHLFNDLAITQAGDVYLTDTRAGAVWYLRQASEELLRLPGSFQSANGIALSADGRFLYASAFPDGISIVDLATRTAAPLQHAANLCLANVDGLYFYRGTLLAIQNGWMVPRVVRLFLSLDGKRVERFQVLERRHPLFDGVTTGVLVGNEFFYMANIQDDKTRSYNPIRLLCLHL